MTFVSEMADLAHEFLDAGPETLGEDVVISQPGAGSYDPATRKRTATPADATQTVRGTFDGAGLQSQFEGLAGEKLDRILTAAPLVSGGFEPKAGMKVVGEGNTYRVVATDHVKKQNTPILWVCGLVLA